MTKPAPRTGKVEPPYNLPLFLSDPSAATQPFPITAVLPEQFRGLTGMTSAVGGEIALMRAVLGEAIECFQKHADGSSRRTRRLVGEAEQWFLADDIRWPFSFVNICTVLGLNAEYVRRGLKAWRQALPTCPTRGRPQRILVSRSSLIAA
jgi:hypothetical protein